MDATSLVKQGKYIGYRTHTHTYAHTHLHFGVSITRGYGAEDIVVRQEKIKYIECNIMYLKQTLEYGTLDMIRAKKAELRHTTLLQPINT